MKQIKNMENMNMENKRKGANSVWLQVTAGQGPKECGWVVAQVVKAIVQDAQNNALKADIVESLAYDKALRKQSLIEPDAYRSVLLLIEGGCDGGCNGERAQALAKRWQGSIKWQGESEFRTKHKRVNWFVGVIALDTPDTKSTDSIVETRDLSFEAMRSGGPGGQHVNKTSSAIRLTHLPTGIQVRVDTDRSQHRNKQIAIERLKMILEQGAQESRKENIRDRWQNHYQVNRGNPVRVFFGQDFKEKQ